MSCPFGAPSGRIPRHERACGKARLPGRSSLTDYGQPRQNKSLGQTQHPRLAHGERQNTSVGSAVPEPTNFKTISKVTPLQLPTNRGEQKSLISTRFRNPHVSAERKNSNMPPRQASPLRLTGSTSVKGKGKARSVVHASSSGSPITPGIGEEGWTVAAIKERLTGILSIPFDREIRDMIAQRLSRQGGMEGQGSLADRSWIQDQDDIILFHDGVRLDCNSSHCFELSKRHRFVLLVPILNVMVLEQRDDSRAAKINWRLRRGFQQLTPVVLDVDTGGQFHLHHSGVSINPEGSAKDLRSVLDSRLPVTLGRATPNPPWIGPSLLEEIREGVSTYSLLSKSADILRFKLYGDGDENRWTWYSYSPQMSIDSGALSGADLRMHAARKLGFDRSQIGLTFVGNFGPRLGGPTVWDSDVKIGKSQFIQGFMVMLNPSPQFIVFGKRIELDLSGKCDLKFRLKLGDYKAWIASQLHIDRTERIEIYLENQKLTDDSRSLKEFKISREARIGWKPIVFYVEVRNHMLKSCIVCIEDVPTSEFPKQIAGECKHPTNVCGKCLKQSIGVDLESNGWDMIRCPECKVTLQHADVRRCARKQDFEL